MANEKPLIVVGMHRSGTSFSASWIHSMGLNLGDNLMGAGLGNVKGHFEDMDFHDIHEWIFKNNRIKYGALRFPIEFTLTIEEKERLNKLIKSKVNSYSQWGWKEPRTCLFLDYYHEALPKAKYFILFRPCNEVVDSLLRRDTEMFDRKYPKKSLLHWIKYKLRKKTYHKNIRRFNTDNHIKIWTYYNQKIKEHIERLTPDDYIVYDQKSLRSNDKEAFESMIKWGFDLDYKSINDLFDKKLFKDIDVENYTNCSYPEVALLEKYFKDLINI